jgi:hypothetical protein
MSAITFKKHSLIKKLALPFQKQEGAAHSASIS